MSIFIIAEIGINHNGNIDTCKKLIDLAIKANCNAVKFQKREIDQVYTQEFLSSSRESPWGNTQRDQKEGLEFKKSEYDEINDYCNRNNIIWFASAWDISSQQFLSQYNLKYNKIASAMLIHKELLKVVAKEKKHTFISTGMSHMDDIKYAVDLFNSFSCPFELMHSVSTYPMKDKHANLLVIKKLQEEFDCDVGYSGHETGVAISTAAVAMGVTSIERHITLDRTMYGSDQAASLESNGLFNLVTSIRKIEEAMGDGVKRILPEESEVAKKLREHIL